MTETLTDRFWSKVDRSAGPDGCWLWTASTNHKGYGYINVANGRREGAHRVALRLSGVDIPRGMMALHSCDTPRCVNPRHLRVGTAADNSADMVARGRQGCKPQCGEQNPKSKLTDDQVRQIRAGRDCGLLLRDLADTYRVSISVIHNVATRRTWAHV